MADNSKRLSPGDRWRPTADVLNGYQDAADYVRDEKAGSGALPGPGAERKVVVATIKNTSGRDCARFDVLGIDTPIFPPGDDPEVFCSRVGVSCVIPKVSDHAARFVVLLEPAAQDALVRACLVGVVPVRLKVTYEWHQFAHIENDEPTRLVSDCVGYPILWKDDKENEDENGNRWALVKIGGPGIGMGVWKNAGAATVGSHEHFRVTGVESSNPTAVTGIRPSDRFGPDYAVNGSQQVATGEYGIYQRSDQVFVAHGVTSPEPGDHLGPVPGSGAVVRNYPPTCRCLGAVDAEHGIVLAASCRPVQRFKLRENLYECGTAPAQIMGRSGYIYTTRNDYAPDTVGDTLGAVAQSPLAIRDGQTGKLYIPAGKCLNARYAHDPGDFWEVLDFSECTCGESSGSSSLSGSWSQSGSPSGSVPSASGGSQSVSGGSWSGSDKSTAIVPASWTPTGYTALFIAECPEVRFDDVAVANIAQKNTCLPIDAKFLEVCEPNSVQVCGCVTDIPLMVGAVVEGAEIRVRFAEENRNQNVRMVIRLTGIRKGFRKHRFPNRTKTQFEANERFIQSAYPGGK